MSVELKGMLKDVFGFKPINQPKEIVPPVVDQNIPQDQPQLQAPKRDIAPIDTVGNVQALIWNSGTPPVPKPPTAKMTDQGVAPNLSNQSGWGKL